MPILSLIYEETFPDSTEGVMIIKINKDCLIFFVWEYSYIPPFISKKFQKLGSS